MSMTVWQWFERRSFHHRDFQSLALLPADRSADGSKRPTVTLILPCRNVAETIGSILDTVARLRERTGMPEQVIVVDADSADGTADIARGRGAEVYSENQLMLRYGPAQGKGDAMWRAVSVARGDIVMFADADTTDFREHFIYGTLGPLLADPTVQFCKAAFRRPFTSGERSVADGGGRVTELMAKPLVNLFYPQLAGFVQPLAGEFAARRDLLGAIPFFTGYGVEIGMLIDVYNEVGLRGMAQVDLGTRQNRHQPLASLSRMSSVVLRTVAREGIAVRSADRADGRWDVHQPETYLHAVATAGGLRLDEHLNDLVERPPLARLADEDAISIIALSPAGGFARGARPPAPARRDRAPGPDWGGLRRATRPGARRPRVTVRAGSFPS
jgi:glucosyl-3-phosphoglycerate synthase